MVVAFAIFFGVIFSYIILGAFMFWFGEISFLFGNIVGFFNIPFDFINTYLFPVKSFVYFAYGSLIFTFMYKIMKSVFISKK